MLEKEKDEIEEEPFFLNDPPFLSFPCSLPCLRWFSLSSNRFLLFLFLLFSFSFKSLAVYVIFKYLAERPTRHMWNTLFCILQFEPKSTSRGKIHQAHVEHAVLNLAFLKPNPQVVEKFTRHLRNMLFCI